MAVKGQSIRYIEIDKGAVKHDTGGQVVAVNGDGTVKVAMWHDLNNVYVERDSVTVVAAGAGDPTADGSYAKELV
jgi:hypothetical protein